MVKTEKDDGPAAELTWASGTETNNTGTASTVITDSATPTSVEQTLLPVTKDVENGHLHDQTNSAL